MAQKEKTNIQHLRELINNTIDKTNCEEKTRIEILEFIDAIEDEKEKDEKHIKELKKEVKQLEDEVLFSTPELESFKEIDCGIGKIEYRADNLKLEMIMEDFKDKMEHKAKFGAGV